MTWEGVLLSIKLKVSSYQTHPPLDNINLGQNTDHLKVFYSEQKHENSGGGTFGRWDEAQDKFPIFVLALA